jgi:RNA-directed DNA polymerase
VDADLSKYFDTIPHQDLLLSVARRISDGAMLHLVKLWLKAPVEETDEKGVKRRTGGRDHDQGTPQGGVISPLLANIYMRRFTNTWEKRGMNEKFKAKIVNYADDFVILSRGYAQEALDVTRRWMAKLKLTLNEKKTCIRRVRRESFDFLGYTFGTLWSRRTGRSYLGASPSKKSLGRARERISEVLTSGNQKPWPEIARHLNQWVRGWTGYFSHGTLAAAYRTVQSYLLERSRAFLARRHKESHRGSRRFSYDWLLEESGLVTPLTLLPVRQSQAFRETSPRAVCGKSARTVR